MQIADLEKFRRYRDAGTSFREVLLVAMLFASLGAIAWAIRGTSGWSGIDGTLVPGLMWGVLWWHVCWRKGIDARGVVLWLGLGISLGGELGYGQYVSWIRGIFNVGDEIVPIEAWVGWLWFAICGIGWAAPGGIALGWALAGRKSLGVWLSRLVVTVGIGVLTRLVMQKWPWLILPNWELGFYVAETEGVFDRGADLATQGNMLGLWLMCVLLCGVAWFVAKRASRVARGMAVCAVGGAMALLLIVAQWLFFPEAQLCLFAGELGSHLGRTVYTQSQNAIVVGWWLGALLVAAVQRDRFTLVAGLVLGIGFGVLFPISAVWCLAYGSESYATLVDWWKMWELNSGFFLGPLYVGVLYWAMRQVDDGQYANSKDESPNFRLWCETLGKVFGLGLILYVTAREDFLVVGMLLAIFYGVAMFLAMLAAEGVVDRLRAVSFVYAVFLLVFIMAWGVSTQAGILLGLYDASLTSQYAWPAWRVIIFTPVGLLITGAALLKMWHIRCNALVGLPAADDVPLVSARLIDLMAFLGVVGAVSIWPAKIVVFYVLFLGLGLFAFNRVNIWFARVDA